MTESEITQEYAPRLSAIFRRVAVERGVPRTYVEAEYKQLQATSEFSTTSYVRVPVGLLKPVTVPAPYPWQKPARKVDFVPFAHPAIIHVTDLVHILFGINNRYPEFKDRSHIICSSPACRVQQRLDIAGILLGHIEGRARLYDTFVREGRIPQNLFLGYLVHLE